MMSEKDYEFIKSEYIDNMKVGDVLYYFDTVLDKAKKGAFDSDTDVVLALIVAKCEFLCECMYKKRHGNKSSYKEWLDKQIITDEFEEQMKKIKAIAAHYEPSKTSTKETPLLSEEKAAINHGYIFIPLARAKELWDCIRQFCKYRDKTYNYPARFISFSKGRTSLYIDFTSRDKCYVKVAHFGEVVYKYEFDANSTAANFLPSYSRRITKHLGAYARKLEKMIPTI